MKDEWEYVKIKGNKKHIYKKVNGKLKEIKIEPIGRSFNIFK